MDIDGLEWDEPKREQNLQKHGIDFMKMRAAFDGRPVLTREVPRGGETRNLSVFMVDAQCIAVVWVRRGSKARIISARGASSAERRAYRQLLL